MPNGKKKVLITGVTGQDGSYLSEFLLNRGDEVYGGTRVVSTDPPNRVRGFNVQPYIDSGQFKFVRMEMTDSFSVANTIKQVRPHRIYNLAAQSNVGHSFEMPEWTWRVNHFGWLNILHAVTLLDMEDDVRLYHALTSELFGNTAKELMLQEQDEHTPMKPVSPYGDAKYASFRALLRAVNPEYGKSTWCTGGILFNHESERRGLEFVTRKITRALARIKYGLQDVLELGNLSAERDWGHAKDYVEAMWRMLEWKNPHNFVVATGETHSVREFVESACHVIGWEIEWSGEGDQEIGVNQKGDTIVRVNPEFYRPTDVHRLCGNYTMAKEFLGWEPKIRFTQLVNMMMEFDLAEVSAQA